MNQRFGPYKTLTTHDGISVPLYMIRFDKRGKLDMLDAVAKIAEIVDKAKDCSDVFFFSHGWNNVWDVALERYESFFREYSLLRQQHRLPVPEGYKPMMIGVFWPSAVLAFGESERGPRRLDMAAQAAEDYPEDQFLRDLEEIADNLADEQDRDTLYALAQTPDLDDADALKLAELLAKEASDTLGEIDSADDIDPQVLLDNWKQASSAGGLGVPGYRGPQLMNLQVQGNILGKLSLRNIIRMFTFAMMKDRAGVVGHVGVSRVLQGLLDYSPAKIHLIGHSYGTKVMLSALGNTSPKSRKVHSALLLQPAISYLAFADRLPGRSGTGGYHRLLDRVEAPIFSTFSSHDSALHMFFHLALIRRSDVGEIRVQQAGAEPPSPYAALGGYGPRQSGERLIPLLAAPSPYVLEPGIKIYGLNGSDRGLGGGVIEGHGDVSNAYTAWALHTLVWHGR